MIVEGRLPLWVRLGYESNKLLGYQAVWPYGHKPTSIPHSPFTPFWLHTEFEHQEGNYKKNVGKS